MTKEKKKSVSPTTETKKNDTPLKPLKKRKNGRAKGAKFERVTAKLITVWWDEDFHRTPASGGLHWKKDNRVAGDIVPPPDSDFPFSVECKKVEGWNFEQVIKGTGEVFDWWKQCIRDSKEIGKIPLLIFSKNNSPIYYMTTQTAWRKVSGEDSNHFLTCAKIDGESHHVAIGFFDNLLSVPKEELLNALK